MSFKYTIMIYSAHRLQRALHMQLVSGNFPCSRKPCQLATTCVDLAGNKSLCVPPSRYKDDVGMFVCAYVNWSCHYIYIVQMFVYACKLCIRVCVNGYHREITPLLTYSTPPSLAVCHWRGNRSTLMAD